MKGTIIGLIVGFALGAWAIGAHAQTGQTAWYDKNGVEFHVGDLVYGPDGVVFRVHGGTATQSAGYKTYYTFELTSCVSGPGCVYVAPPLTTTQGDSIVWGS